MSGGRARCCWRLGLAVVLLLPGTGAHAWRLSYDVSLGVEYTDNVGRRSVDPQEEYIVRPEVRFALTEAGERVQADIVGTVAWRDYRRGVFDDELRTDIGARMNFSLLQERLAWSVENYLAVEPVDVFVSASPDNVQRTNYFSTGPTLSLRFSPVLSARTELRWQDTYAEVDSEFNSTRVAAALRLLRLLDASTEVSGHVEALRVRPDESFASVFTNDRLTAYGRWVRQSGPRSLSADLGYSWADFDEAEDSDGVLLRASMSHDLSESSTIDVELVREYTDAAADLLLRAPTAADLDRPITSGAGFVVGLTPDVFLDRRAGAGWTLRGQRLQTRAWLEFREQTFDRSPSLDRRTVGGAIELDYRLTPTATVGAFLTGYDLSNLAFGTDAREIDIGLRLRYQARSALWLVAELARSRRSGDLPTDDFTETRAFIGLMLTRD